MKDVDKTLIKHTQTHKAMAEVAVHGKRFGKQVKPKPLHLPKHVGAQILFVAQMELNGHQHF